MAQSQQTSFQLFPVVPKSQPNRNPFRKTPRRRSIKEPDVSPVIEDIKFPGQTEAVIFRIIEDTSTITPPPAARTAPLKSPTTVSSPLETRSTVTTQLPCSRVLSPSTVAPKTQFSKSRVSKRGKGTAKPFIGAGPRPDILHSKANGKSKDDSQGLNTTSPRSASPGNLDAAGSPQHDAPPNANEISLPATMRSMFPLYDPNLPPDKQNYFPQRASRLPQLQIPNSGQSSNPSSIPLVARLATTTAPTRNESVSIASMDGLARLWELTNGDMSERNLGTYHLKMQKIDAFTFVFGAKSSPFYTLRTNPMNDIEIHRIHPSKLNTKTPVLTLNISDFGRTPSGLAMVLFPKLAEIVTREEAMEVARRNRLAPQFAMEIENEALRRSVAQNSCILELQAAQYRYCLYHPALTEQGFASAVEFAALRSPSEQLGLLHVTVLTSLPNTIATRRYPKIQVALPQRDGICPVPLVSLDLETMTLSVFSEQILSTIPSYYGIDTIVAAILTVSLFNETTQSILASMTINSPKTPVFPDSCRTSSVISEPTVGRSGLHFITTQAEREEAEEAALMEQIRSQPRPQTKTRFSLMSILPRARKIDNGGTAKSKRKTKRLEPMIIEEIDLEQQKATGAKAHTSSSFPKLTRILLNSILWIISAIMWVAMVGMKFFAYTIIGMMKCLTRQKS